MLVIDPSSGSSSSMPGYALFSKGELLDSGVLLINSSLELPRRLKEIATCLQTAFVDVDVLVIEDIPVRAYGRNAAAHATLLKSIGCFLACAKYNHFVEISPSVWKSYLLRDPSECQGYEKNDEWDAKVMGYCVLDIARSLQKKRKTNDFT